ncbi:hypothetical protein [Geitlerinema sp. PCC 9228]|jgi:hypothetical protein|nr:hypothetical protein [Geitlerinema sp. PCC 9228]
MTYYKPNTNIPFQKIVYSKIKINGKLRLIPMELYADGTVRRHAY